MEMKLDLTMDVFRIVKFNTLFPIIYHGIDVNATQTHLYPFDIRHL